MNQTTIEYPMSKSFGPWICNFFVSPIAQKDVPPIRALSFNNSMGKMSPNHLGMKLMQDALNHQ
jgi:hypothetical protein